MRVYKIDSKSHGVEEVTKKGIPKLINALKPAHFKITIEDEEFFVCGDLTSKSPIRITGIAIDMKSPVLLDDYVIYRDKDLTDEDVKFLEQHIEAIVDPDFDDDYYAIIGITDIEDK